MTKQITFDEEARTKIQSGINKLADVVKSTLGPGGANVILERAYGYNHITKDGVTVAREITLEDPIENIGAQIVKEAASKTATMAGDGTTTATVLAQAIFNQGIKMIAAGANRMDIKRGIDIAVKVVVEELKRMSKPVSDQDIMKIAMISSNGDPVISGLINDAITKVGKDGLVSVEDGKGNESYTKVLEGTRFERGYLSPYFVSNQEKMEVEFNDGQVLIYDGVIDKFQQLLPILDKMRRTGIIYPLLIIAEDVQGDALATLTMNHMKGNGIFCAVQSPDYGDSRKEGMKDFAALTGATIIAKETGLTLGTAGVEVLGSANKIRVTQWNTTIIGGKGTREAIDGRVATIDEQLKDANGNAEVKLKDRRARLVNGMAVIYVGGNSNVEIMEKKDRIDDALQATRAALEEGIIVGGGVAYVRAKATIENTGKPVTHITENGDQVHGFDILMSAIELPLKTIAANVGESGEVVLNRIQAYKHENSFNYGFNAKTKVYEDLIEAGVIDPTKVTRLALENAASVAGLLLTTRAVVNIKPQ